MNANDFYNWRHDPVTVSVFSQLKERLDYLIEEVIAQTATMSQSEMAEKTGAIKAIRDLLNIEFEEPSEEPQE